MGYLPKDCRSMVAILMSCSSNEALRRPTVMASLRMSTTASRSCRPPTHASRVDTPTEPSPSPAQKQSEPRGGQLSVRRGLSNRSSISTNRQRINSARFTRRHRSHCLTSFRKRPCIGRNRVRKSHVPPSPKGCYLFRRGDRAGRQW